MNGISISPALRSSSDPPTVMATGATSCSTATPMLPPAALRPSAQPFSRSGKKNEMLAMLEAKFPPPSPAVAAAASRTG